MIPDTIDTSLVICPKCKGEGNIRNFEYVSPYKGSEMKEVVCPECKGKRVLKKVVKTSFTAVE